MNRLLRNLRTRNLRKTLRQEWNVWRVGALPGLAIIVLITVGRLAGTLQYLELIALDYMLRFRPAEPTDERILIVGINEADIRQAQTYPIPDAQLAALIRQVQQYQPAAIGLDIFRDLPVEPGHAEFVQVLRSSNLIAIEKVLPDTSGLTINPPAYLPAEQIGFVDTVLDFDGYVRRNLLGTPNLQGEYKFSLTFRLAEKYLSQRGIPLSNGKRDPRAMRFGEIELTRFTANTGGYVGADANGNQVLINFRSGYQPFRTVSMAQILAGTVDASWIRDRVVLIGVMSLSEKDIVNSRALIGRNPNLVHGVEIQAHALSQILSGVLDGRPLLQVWPEGWEYAWIVLWGILGISLGRWLRAPFLILLGLGVTGVVLIGLCYGLLLLGWWVPVAPALLVLLANGAGLTAALFYRHEQNLKARIQERQLVIDQTFTAIHNGPLQTLAILLRTVQDQEPSQQFLYGELQKLNQELRTVCESVQQEAFSQENRFRISQETTLDLDSPLREILYAVYSDTVRRDLPNFKTLRLKLPTFDQMDDPHLTIDQKKGLCRFLQEALCNVGKHAQGVTRLEVICKQENGKNMIRVIDNGTAIDSTSMLENPALTARGRGTEQAESLARQLGGRFQRRSNSPHGVICELIWPIAKPRFWRF
ncbi:CHASE2 domain-containing protein [Leptolyngbya sp. NK1-12]|uniref:CHASE2 domain-containing protein n=1 Tax=Leptolyngbya sp. NK1-12 TaxID=2547451 RepID=A0AA96WL54_9CYAN|nr:CHASE2 domain-containing protein [Leptolyngbya sp. NK1-12]